MSMYNAMFSEHRAKFSAIVAEVGRQALEDYLPKKATPEAVREALSEGDVHLHTIPLFMWDRQHDLVRPLAERRTGKVWPLSYTVCAWKEAARQRAERGE